MIRQEEVFKIGKIGKPHGVKGEVAFRFSDDVFDRVDAEYLIMEVGSSVLTGCDVWFPRSLASVDDEELTWSQIVGYELRDVDNHGNEHIVGSIVDVDESTENVLLTLDNGMLVPAAYELIVDIDHSRRCL